MADTKLKLDPKSAANKIRPLMKTTPPPFSPEDRHALAFAEQVCTELKLEPSAANVAYVGNLMAKANIEQYVAQPYPFMLSERDDRNRLVARKWPENHPTRAGLPIVFASPEEWAFFQANGSKGIDQADMDAWAGLEHPAEPPEPPNMPDGSPQPAKPVAPVKPPAAAVPPAPVHPH